MLESLVMSDEGYLKVAGYVKKLENILSSSANSLHNLNMSVYCTVFFFFLFFFVCARARTRA